MFKGLMVLMFVVAALTAFPTSVLAQSTDPLPSWNEGVAKSAIVDFVNRVTRENSSDFVPISDRIAVFDNDGTLWTEQPYVQIMIMPKTFTQFGIYENRVMVGNKIILKKN